MLYIHLRCITCHEETEALPLSVNDEPWPVLVWRQTFCKHRAIEARLTESPETA